MFLRKGKPKSGEKESFLRKTSEVRNERGFRGLVGKIRKKRQSDLDDFLVIGIDFGTTLASVVQSPYQLVLTEVQILRRGMGNSGRF
jgi:hypothetical protein